MRVEDGGGASFYYNLRLIAPGYYFSHSKEIREMLKVAVSSLKCWIYCAVLNLAKMYVLTDENISKGIPIMFYLSL